MRAFVAILLASSALCAAARAQDATTSVPPDQAPGVPQTVVVTATRVPSLLDTIPASVTVIDRATIEARGYTTLAQALADVPGLHIVQTGGAGEVASVFMRGTNSNQVLVLRDGMRIDDPSISNDAFNFGIDGLSDVERIEIVRGPASGLYGSGAIGGVINIITRKGKGKPHGSVTLAAGLPRQAIGSANLSGASGMLDYALSLDRTYQQGFDATPKRETTVYAGVHDGFQADTVTLNLGLTPIEGTRLSLQLRGRDSKYKYPDVAYPAFDDPNEDGYDKSASGRLGVQSTLLDGRWKTSLFADEVEDGRHYINLLDATDPNQAVENSRYNSRRFEQQWNNDVSLPDWGAVQDTHLTFGIDNINDSAKINLNSQSGGSLYTQNLKASEQDTAGWLGLQTVLLRNLTLTANAREESVSGVGKDLTWRVGGLYRLGGTGVRLKASYGTGFRAPSLFDRYGIDDFGYVGNPNLRPERSDGVELGVGYDLAAFGARDFASIDVTWFDNDVRDLITTQFSPVYTQVNVGRARMQGVETSLTLRPATWLTAQLGYTYVDARDLGTGSLLLRRPRNAFNASARIEPMPDLTILPSVRYIGSFADDLVDNGGYPAGVGLAKPGTLVDLAVNYKIREGIILFVRGSNIFDAQYEPASGFAAPGAQVLAGTTLRF